MGLEEEENHTWNHANFHPRGGAKGSIDSQPSLEAKETSGSFIDKGSDRGALRSRTTTEAEVCGGGRTKGNGEMKRSITTCTRNLIFSKRSKPNIGLTIWKLAQTI